MTIILDGEAFASADRRKAVQAQIDSLPFFITLKRSEAKVLYPLIQAALQGGLQPAEREVLGKVLSDLKQGLTVGENL